MYYHKVTFKDGREVAYKFLNKMMSDYTTYDRIRDKSKFTNVKYHPQFCRFMQQHFGIVVETVRYNDE